MFSFINVTLLSSATRLDVEQRLGSLNGYNEDTNIFRAPIRAEVDRNLGIEETLQQTRNLEDILEPIIKITTNYTVLDSRLFFIRNMKRSKGGPAAFEFVSIIDDAGQQPQHHHLF